MAALTPGALSKLVTPPDSMLGTNYMPNSASYSYGTNVGMFRPSGYEYHPPTTGQLWPRGDYAPTG